MARRGRKTNWDKKVAELIADLRRALVAREQDRIEATVSAQMSSLVGGLTGGDSTPAPVAPTPSAPAAATGRGNRKPRSAASLAKQAAAMRRSWAKRNAAKAAASKAAPKKKGKAAAAATMAAKAKPSPKTKAGKQTKAKKAAPASKKSGRPGKVSPGRARQIAAMKKYWAEQKAEKGKSAEAKPAPAAAAST